MNFVILMVWMMSSFGWNVLDGMPHDCWTFSSPCKGSMTIIDNQILYITTLQALQMQTQKERGNVEWKLETNI